MGQTFVFEELDEATREYLLAVRDTQGEGAPGVFAPTTSSMAGCGCIAGPIVIIATLIMTLTTWINLVYDDPVKLAFLQTAGLLVGGWLLVAGLRTRSGRASKSIAGNWVYVDPLHLYEAYREQLTITRIDDALEAQFTHHYSNTTYQHSVVTIKLGGTNKHTIQLNDPLLAEQIAAFLNYLAWARGPEGGDQSRLPPASLGAVAKYIVVHAVEPRNSEGNLDLNLVRLAVPTVPEEPKQASRAAPNILPYIVMLAAGVGIFFVMAEVINPVVRDAAIYRAVIQEPCEPWYLRLYLLDHRNTAHREEVLRRLGQEYDELIGKLQNRPGDPNLRKGMIAILHSLKIPEQPLVSLKVMELAGPPGGQERVEKLRDGLVGTIQEHKADPNAKAFDYLAASGGIVGEFALLMPSVTPPPGVVFAKPRTARGIQMIEFAQMPEDATHAHFEVAYQLLPDPTQTGGLLLSVRMEIRTTPDGDPVATYTEEAHPVRPAELAVEMTRLQDRLLAGLVGKAPAVK
jgi:hypothetical protein